MLQPVAPGFHPSSHCSHWYLPLGCRLACGAAIFSHQCRRVLHLGLNLKLKDQTMQAATSPSLVALPLPFLVYLLFQLRSVNREWSRLARAFRAGVIARKRIETSSDWYPWSKIPVWIDIPCLPIACRSASVPCWCAIPMADKQSQKPSPGTAFSIQGFSVTLLIDASGAQSLW